MFPLGASNRKIKINYRVRITQISLKAKPTTIKKKKDEKKYIGRKVSKQNEALKKHSKLISELSF